MVAGEPFVGAEIVGDELGREGKDWDEEELSGVGIPRVATGGRSFLACDAMEVGVAKAVVDCVDEVVG